MSEPEGAFVLRAGDPAAPAPVLTAVRGQGRLDGVLFELTLRQTYRNGGPDTLEVVYTFPLPPQAVLLGFASELGGQRSEGRIVAKADAEARYETALADGDAPVMLESLGDGLYSANIGNLKPGDQIVLEVRFAELLAFDQGRLRLAVPTTIAPRYGVPALAGLQPQQVPQFSLDAEYPFELVVDVGPALAGAALECPSHRMRVVDGAAGTRRLELVPGAVLDRDVVVVVTPREPRPSLVVSAADDGVTVLLAALRPPASTGSGGPLLVKLLVDCSGSMAGDGIAAARGALRGVVAALGEEDQVSLSRFGDRVEHLVQPAPLSRSRPLARLIDGLQADLGGTELEGALRAVMALPGRAAGADVLLITDGQVWQAAEMVAAAARSGHRVFAIGVGSAPAEGALRKLAEATGGACEFVSPNEAVEAASRRMLRRMRQPAWAGVQIDWGAPALWQAGLPAAVFGGDTVTAYAAFARPPQAAAIRLLARDTAGNTIELARGEAMAPAAAGDGLPRMAAARRLAAIDDEPEALALALRHQLMSKATNCILVHVRAAGEKAGGVTRLQRIGSMLAAGWGGTGTVVRDVGSSDLSVQPFSRGFHAAFNDMFGASAAYAPAPAMAVRRDAASSPLQSLAWQIVDFVGRTGSAQGLSAFALLLRPDGDLQRAIDGLKQLGLGADDAWLVFALWVLGEGAGLQQALAAVAPSLIDAGLRALDRELAADSMRLQRPAAAA